MSDRNWKVGELVAVVMKEGSSFVTPDNEGRPSFKHKRVIGLVSAVDSEGVWLASVCGRKHRIFCPYSSMASALFDPEMKLDRLGFLRAQLETLGSARIATTRSSRQVLSPLLLVGVATLSGIAIAAIRQRRHFSQEALVDA